jgi:Zn-dependent peptidase ImmA (M78 family)
MIRTFPHEFVLKCEEIALERRGELGLEDDEPIDPRRLAEDLLAIGVITVDHYRDRHPEAVGQLTERDAIAFNAMAVFHGTRCLIVVNPSQGSGDEALSIAHEIAHIELEHERLEAPLFDEDGTRRSWRPAEEAEAEYLAREILVPRRGLQAVLGLDHVAGIRPRAATHFGVSPALIRRRLIETGLEVRERRPRIEIPADRAIELRPTNGIRPGATTRPRP